jgi:hypothetical protein
MGAKRSISITVKMTKEDWLLLEKAAEILWPRAPLTKSSLLLTMAKLHAEGILEGASRTGIRGETFNREMARETAYQDMVKASMSGIAREELLQRIHHRSPDEKEEKGQLVTQSWKEEISPSQLWPVCQTCLIIPHPPVPNYNRLRDTLGQLSY